MGAGGGADGQAEGFWEAHYRRSPRVWTGRANAVLADVAAPLAPGTALDLGCGEGGDAVWLARRGWRVTAVDVSATALARVREHAAAAGVGDRVVARQHDLARTFPAGAYDLVAASYLQSPVHLPRTAVLRAAAGAVAPGGLLLVVEHASVPPWSWADPGTRFPAPEEVLASLDLPPATWHPERVGAFQREATGPGGQRAAVTDTVLAVRRAGAA
ncbi:cyclopropane-fatty-acyl-phospholipid synthase family protein [Quadrisphaera sp. DSM 44207]|uniref:SAM-dependent methyltransferase n=1 Tax=Quadrisphaera sp. DSM 44207 TaxID=1881057 RepID=UPI00088F4C63|nr:class I SAM-dependent methyltransferase [Quadrisphaera sp. DSM 44207]SDQ06983.1 Methyltransferase domain-containing protein [Quadrisphaera sp. DSM 44207]